MCQQISCVRIFATPSTVTSQAPLSIKFSRQEYWNGQPFPSPEDLPDPEIEPISPALQADSLPSEPPGKPQLLLLICILILYLTILLNYCLYQFTVGCFSYHFQVYYLLKQFNFIFCSYISDYVLSCLITYLLNYDNIFLDTCVNAFTFLH